MLKGIKVSSDGIRRQRHSLPRRHLCKPTDSTGCLSAHHSRTLACKTQPCTVTTASVLPTKRLSQPQGTELNFSLGFVPRKGTCMFQLSATSPGPRYHVPPGTTAFRSSSAIYSTIQHYAQAKASMN